MVESAGFEPTFTGSGPVILTKLDELSINGRNGEIRTHDPLIPNQMLYQAEPRPDNGLTI